MGQRQGLQDTKTAGYILVINGQTTICLVPNRQMSHILYWVQSHELSGGYSGEESGKAIYLLIQGREVHSCMVLMYVFKCIKFVRWWLQSDNIMTGLLRTPM